MRNYFLSGNMVSERKTDKLVRARLESAGIKYDEQISENPEINEALKGASKNISKEGEENKGYPEFMAQVNDFFIVIEDKPDTLKQVSYYEKDTNKLDMSENAIKNYAENGALHYAQHIIKKSPFKKIFAFGCSGTDEKHLIIRPIFIDENGYKLLNEVKNFENFNEKNINKYYHEIVLGLPSEEEIEIKELIDTSKQLHKDLRKYGNLSEKEKPLVVSAILLALDYGLDLKSLKGKDGKDGKKIYDNASYNLPEGNDEKKYNRDNVLSHFEFIKTRPKLINCNKELKKTPLKYFAETISKKIFPSIQNVNADLLGYFYNEFIRYTGGDGQNLGIVLTPRHITSLFCDLLDIQPSDKIFDPCCGTGSFLIAGMNRMIEQKEGDEKAILNIKQNNIHGIESNENMFAICTTNMILRGDGKSNLKLADFLEEKTEDLRKNNYTIGVMNPPYSLKGLESERHFIKHLLDSLADRAKCAVIVPQSVMGNKDGGKRLKQEIFKNHTLEGVITLGKQTFNNIGAVPCIAIFTAHQPHPENKRCKFINFKDDGYEIHKNVGLVKTERAIERKKHLLECWHYNKPAESKFMVETKVKYDDEWLHSYYYFNDEIPSENVFKETMEEYIEFEFEMILKDKSYLFKE